MQIVHILHKFAILFWKAPETAEMEPKMKKYIYSMRCEKRDFWEKITFRKTYTDVLKNIFEIVWRN